MQVTLRALVAGMASFAPILRDWVCGGTGGTSSARYCYSVWLRHAVLAARAGFSPCVGKLAELGPGESLGIGLAAVLSGVERYVALDAKKHSAAHANLAVFEELASLYFRHAPIPDDEEFPDVYPKLSSYAFPQRIFNEAMLQDALEPRRVEALRESLRMLDRGGGEHSGPIRYLAPWDPALVSTIEPVDMVISQAVMEHVEDVPGTYAMLYRWLRPGGFMSHTVDFTCHGLTRTWGGHWTLGDAVWRVVKGSRPYLINRLPHSAHIRHIEAAGFRVLADVRTVRPAADRSALAPRFAGISDDDLTIAGSLIQAIKL